MPKSSTDAVVDIHLDVHRLVMPVDLSDAGWRALPFATAVADRLGIPLTMVHVDTSGLGAADAHGPNAQLHVDVDGHAASVDLLTGWDPAEVILRTADAQPCSRIVLASHGLGRRLADPWGSVGEAVLRQSSHGILVTGARFDAARHAAPQRVVAGVDAAAPDYDLMTEALHWANGLDVPMVVVTVRGSGRSRPGEDETYQVIGQIFEALPAARVPVTAEVLDDRDIAESICRFADRSSGTLLALAPGAQDRSVHWLVHPVTSEVVRRTTAPLLLRWHESGRTDLPRPLSELPDMFDAEQWR